MRFFPFVILLLAVSPHPSLAQEKQKLPDWIVQSWEGMTLKGVLTLVPPPFNGEVTTQDSFNTLWKIWMADKNDPPRIDFKKQLVVVYTSVEKRVTVGDFLSNQGEFRFVEVKEKPNPIPQLFYFRIHVLDRNKVKSFNNLPLSADLNK